MTQSSNMKRSWALDVSAVYKWMIHLIPSLWFLSLISVWTLKTSDFVQIPRFGFYANSCFYQVKCHVVAWRGLPIQMLLSVSDRKMKRNNCWTLSLAVRLDYIIQMYKLGTLAESIQGFSWVLWPELCWSMTCMLFWAWTYSVLIWSPTVT